MNFVNLTPHEINTNDGRIFKPMGLVRVSAKFSQPDKLGIITQEFGDLKGLPAPKENTKYIVSLLVLDVAKKIGRTDCVAPASGHPETVRNEKGHIVSVPYFIG